MCNVDLKVKIDSKADFQHEAYIEVCLQIEISYL